MILAQATQADLEPEEVPRLFTTVQVMLDASDSPFVQAFYDTGSDINLISPSFVQKHKIPTLDTTPISTLSASGQQEYEITKKAVLQLKYKGGQVETETFGVFPVSLAPLTLGRPWAYKHRVQTDWDQLVPVPTVFEESTDTPPKEFVAVCQVKAKHFMRLIAQDQPRGMLLYSFENPEIATTLAQVSESETDWREKVYQHLPKAYHEFVDVFDKGKADTLPEPRSYDHHIELMPGKCHERR